MIFVLLSVSIVLFLFFNYLKHEGSAMAIFSALCGFIFVGIILVGLQSYAWEHKIDYLDLKYYDNPTQTKNLESLPFKYANEAEVYVSRGKDSNGHWLYTSSLKTENGFDEKIIDTSWGADVYINYINDNDQPYLEIQKATRKGVLIKKPSFWLNFFGWLEYKDVSIGEVVESYDISIRKEIYTFYVPQGSLREIS